MKSIMSVCSLYFLSLFVLFSSFWYGEVHAQCRATACVGLGAACDAISQNTRQVCQVGLFCTPADTCQAKIADNQPCNPSSGYFDQCTNGRCIQTVPSGPYTCQNYYTNRPGEYCTADTQCAFSISNRDTRNSTCFANNTCFGLPLGATCDGSNAQCYEGQCSNRNGGICVPFLTLGAQCNPVTSFAPCGDLECVQTDENDITVGVCAPRGSLAVGALCSSSVQCQDGLECGFGSVRRCAQAAASNTACTDDSQCTAPQVCNCNAASGQGRCYTPSNTIGYTAAALAYSSCRKTAKCSDSFSVDCLFAACPTQFCNFTLYGNSREQLLAALEQPCVNAYNRDAIIRCNITAAQIMAVTGGSTPTSGSTGTGAGTTGTGAGTGTGTTGNLPSSSATSVAFPVSLLALFLSLFLF